jgi:hypothetical protein
MDAMDEVAGIDAEHLGELEDVVQRGISPSPLNLPELAPVQSRL